MPIDEIADVIEGVGGAIEGISDLLTGSTVEGAGDLLAVDAVASDDLLVSEDIADEVTRVNKARIASAMLEDKTFQTNKGKSEDSDVEGEEFSPFDM